MKPIATLSLTVIMMLVMRVAAVGGATERPAGCPELVTADEFKKAGGTTEEIGTSRPPPPYPRGETTDGEVELEVIVGTDGKVVDVRVVSATNPAFERSAVDTVRKWVFRPGKIGGRPVCIVARVSSSFRLEDAEE